MKWAGHVALMGDERNACRILGKPEGNRPIGRPRHRLVDNIEIAFKEIGFGSVDWIDLPQDQWRSLVMDVP
jgi:hypothetical protein